MWKSRFQAFAFKFNLYRYTEDAANSNPFDIDERFFVEGPRKRQKAGTYKESANVLGAAPAQKKKAGGARGSDDDDFEMEGEDDDNGGGGGGGAKKKDPNAPKRPLSSYLIFAMETRSKVLEETPGLSLGDVAKALGARWKAISPEVKAGYEAKARELKVKYEEAIQVYEGATEGGKEVAAARLVAGEAKEARANAWRDAECKALEDAVYSFGVGAAGDCRRACLNAGVARPFAEVSAVAATLVDMIDRVGKVCKARFDELEKLAAENGPVERCKVGLYTCNAVDP
jgi:hypothetical protein